MKFSIIIPAFNEAKLLPETLAFLASGRAVMHQTGVETELIVADNNSTDGTSEIARQAGATVAFEPVNQIGRARNTGARAASGEWLLFLDADSKPSHELLMDLLEVAQDDRVIGGGVTLLQDGNFFGFGVALRLWNRWSRISKEAAGSFLYCRREAFETLGGFDAKFFAGEEIDFSRRLQKLARTRGQKMVILHRHPLLTSSRKATLYKPREFFGFFMKTIFRRGKTLEKREDCPIWYDGRR